MARSYGTSTVKNGLVFFYDQGNRKSYKGAPTTNIITNPLPDGTTNGFTRAGGTSGTVEYDVVHEAIKWTATDQSTWGAYFRIYPDLRGTLDITKQYSISFEWKTDTPSFTYRWQIAQGNGAEPATAQITLTTSGTQISDGWYRFEYTVTPTNIGIGDSDTVNRILISDLGQESIFYIRKLQFEQQDFATPFVKGTRSGIETVLDLTNNHTIGAYGLLNYNSDNTFNFTSGGDGSTNARLQITDPNALQYTEEVTVECIVRVAAAPYNIWGGLLNVGRDISAGYFLYINQSAKFTFVVHGVGGGITLQGPVYTIGEWYHVVATYKNDIGSTMYVNGELGGTTASVGALVYPETYANTPSIGGHGTIYEFDGDIPLVKIYDRELTSNEVKQNFNALRGRFGI